MLAFQAVYTMEMTRRENDVRIRSLYTEMKAMIRVLVEYVVAYNLSCLSHPSFYRLKDVKDPELRDPEGRTITARMQEE